jgi:hypothetical protein
MGFGSKDVIKGGAGCTSYIYYLLLCMLCSDKDNGNYKVKLGSKIKKPSGIIVPEIQ